MSPDDEILGINDYRVRPDQWDLRMEQYHPHEKISVLVARGDRLLVIPVTLDEEPARLWIIEVDPAATPSQIEHLNTWLAPLV